MRNLSLHSQHGKGSPKTVVEALAERISAIETGPSGVFRTVATGWRLFHDDFSFRQTNRLPTGEEVREVVLARGVLHEWVGLCDQRMLDGGGTWSPPLLLLIHLVNRGAGESGRVLWIGRRVWPHHVHLMETSKRPQVHKSILNKASLRSLGRLDVLRRSLFIDPPTEALRWWAIDQALRCPAVSVVVADAQGMDMACSRRLQMAAEQGGAGGAGGALALLARPPWEVRELSAAMTRWRIEPVPSSRNLPTWELECLRCKGVQRRLGTEAMTHPSRLLLEWNRATGCVGIPAELADRSPAPQAASQRIA